MSKLSFFFFGSSHVCAFSGTDELFHDNNLHVFERGEIEYKLQRVDPSTAYNFFWNPDYYPKILNMLSYYNVKNTDYISLILGEIDCRTHLGRISETTGRPLIECIEECVDRYFMCYIDLKRRGYNCIVFSVHPGSTYPPCEKHDSPVFGDFEYRNRLTQAFNFLLEHKCKVHNIPFCNYYYELMESQFKPNMDFFMDYVHIRGTLLMPIIE
jgi:hypothetical protein